MTTTNGKNEARDFPTVPGPEVVGLDAALQRVTNLIRKGVEFFKDDIDTDDLQGRVCTEVARAFHVLDGDGHWPEWLNTLVEVEIQRRGL